MEIMYTRVFMIQKLGFTLEFTKKKKGYYYYFKN